MINPFSEKNLICEIHKSPIGGVCSETKCLEPPFIMCIKCVVDPNCCIRKYNHNLISIKEFFQKFFESKKIEQSRDIISMYKKLKEFDLTKSYNRISDFAEQENKLYSEITSNFLKKLHGIFLKETSKLKEVEDNNLVNLKFCKEMVQGLQREFKIFSEETGEKFYDFEDFSDVLLKQYNEQQIKKDEVHFKLNFYLSKFKSLLNKSNNEEIFFAREIMNSLVNSSFNVNKNLKLDIEKRSKITCDNTGKEVNSYFLNKEKQMIMNRTYKLSENPFISKKCNIKKDTKKFAEQFNVFKNLSGKTPKVPTDKTSAKKSTLSSIIEKEKKLESNANKIKNSFVLEEKKLEKKENSENKKLINFDFEKKKPIKKSPVVFSIDSSFEVQPFQQLQQSKNKNYLNYEKMLKSLTPEDHILSIDFINDDQAIVIDSYNVIVYSNNSSFTIYDFMKKKLIFNLFLPGNVCHQKKYMVKNFNDFIYTLTSDNEILEIKISDYKLKQELSHKFYKINSSVNNLLPVFDMIIEEDSLYENLLIKFYFINEQSNLICGTLNDEKILLDTPYKFSSSNIVNSKICKLETFSNDLKILNDSENSNDTSKLLFSKYIVINTGSIKILQLKSPTPTEFYEVSSVFPNNSCNSFTIENLKSTNEVYLYTVWQNGSMLIHSLKNKQQIKKFLMPDSTPLYSVCYIDENNLLVGCENQMVLLDNSNATVIKPIKFFKNLPGLILGIKIYMEKNQENFICFTNTGIVYLFCPPK
jgi:hypothetical protein